MGIRSIVLGAFLAAIAVNSSSATVRIADDRGGQIGSYMRTYAMVRSSGERVVIDGPCLSACTLLVGIIPPDRVCVTRRARLGFHAAWRPDALGRPHPSALGTQVLWQVYPAKVRHWIRRHGGLSPRMIYLHGRELNAMFHPCR